MTKTGTAPPAADLRDFAAAMHARFIAKNVRGAGQRLTLIIPVVQVAVGAVIGGAARMMLPPAWAALVTCALAALVGAWAVTGVRTLRRNGLVQDVDWETAASYEEQLLDGLPANVRGILARTRGRVRRHLPPGTEIHVYCPGEVPERRALMRVNAAVAPAGEQHAVILVGDRLLASPPALAYALTHEVNHLRRSWRRVVAVLQVIAVGGWIALGLAVPLHALLVAAPALWAMSIAARWADEFAADAAARSTGRDAARAYWSLLRAARARTGLSRLTGAVAAVLAPTHPPVTLRAALAVRAGSRT